MTLKDVEGGGTLIWGTVLLQRSTGKAGEKHDKSQIKIKIRVMDADYVVRVVVGQLVLETLRDYLRDKTTSLMFRLPGIMQLISLPSQLLLDLSFQYSYDCS